MKGKVKITVEGHLDKKWQDWFDEMKISHEGAHTIFTGIIKEESHLHGILNRIRDLNPKLLLVHPISSITLKNTQNES